MPSIAAHPLIRFLAQHGVLKKVPENLTGEGGPIHLLATRGLLNEAQTLALIESKLGIPQAGSAELAKCKELDLQKLGKTLEPSQWWKYRAIPFRQTDQTVDVAFADPFDEDGKRTIRFAFQRTMRVHIASESAILQVLSQLFPANRFGLSNSDAREITQVEESASTVNAADDTTSESGPDTPPIIKLCNKIIADSVALRASDIHLEPEHDGLTVRIRIDGVLQTIVNLPQRVRPHVLTRLKILAGMDIAESRRPQDGRFRMKVDEQQIDLRVSTVPSPFGQKMVLRVLRANLDKLQFDSLELPPNIERPIRGALMNSGKIILVTGPTGSGKTTTLYTFLMSLRDGSRSIQTIEDPIEFRIPGITQIQVNPAIDLTFGKALRSVLRQDPDVILLGEIRDPDSAEQAFHAAQTGHLVLSTVHSNDALSAVPRLLALGIEKSILADCLHSILAQRLVRKICTNCSEPAEAAILELHASLLERYSIPPESVRQGRGCASCRSSGYLGQIGIFSLLTMSPAISDAIFTDMLPSAIRNIALQQGHMELDQAAAARVRDGVASLEEAMPYFATALPSATSETSLPARTATANRFPTPAPVAPAAPRVPHAPRILLVEDDENTRELIAMLLQNECYDVTQAENGKVALEKAYEAMPDLILTDVNMPVMGGKQLLNRLRSSAELGRIPIVMLTAAHSDDAEVGLLDLGATDYVPKSAPSNVLLSRIRRALSQAAEG